jgi:import inner membrane translocase subunit TIM10
MAENAQQAQLQMVAELEMEMMTDMYKRMTNACQEKCIAAHYRESDLTKGELLKILFIANYSNDK